MSVIIRQKKSSQIIWAFPMYPFCKNNIVFTDNVLHEAEN